VPPVLNKAGPPDAAFSKQAHWRLLSSLFLMIPFLSTARAVSADFNNGATKLDRAQNWRLKIRVDEKATS
jgi:hypothetical protein